MKFTLVVTDVHGKNLVFVTKELQVLSLDEAMDSVRQGKILNTYIVQKKTGSYIRTKAGTPASDQFEKIAISFRDLLLFAQGITSGSEPLKKYVDAYVASLQKGQLIVKPVGYISMLASDVKDRLVPQRQNIFDAARQFTIDPYLLGVAV